MKRTTLSMIIAVSAMMFASCKNETKKEIIAEHEKISTVEPDVTTLFPGTDALRCAPGVPMSISISNYSTVTPSPSGDSATIKMYYRVTAGNEDVFCPGIADIAWGANSEERPVLTDTSSVKLWTAIRNYEGRYVDGQMSGSLLAPGAADVAIAPMDGNSVLEGTEYKVKKNKSAIFRISLKIRELPWDPYAVFGTYDGVLQLFVARSANGQLIRVFLRDRPNFISKPTPPFRED